MTWRSACALLRYRAGRATMQRCMEVLMPLRIASLANALLCGGVRFFHVLHMNCCQSAGWLAGHKWQFPKPSPLVAMVIRLLGFVYWHPCYSSCCSFSRGRLKLGSLHPVMLPSRIIPIPFPLPTPPEEAMRLCKYRVRPQQHTLRARPQATRRLA